MATRSSSMENHYFPYGSRLLDNQHLELPILFLLRVLTVFEVEIELAIVVGGRNCHKVVAVALVVAWRTLAQKVIF